MAGQSGFVQEQMSNVTQTMSILQDMVQEMLGLVGQNSIHSASWLGMGSGYSGGSTGNSAGGVAVGASTGSNVANSNIAPTQTGVPFGGSIVVDTVDSLMNSLTSQGQQLVNEGTTQNSINQDNYQQYLEGCTNLLDAVNNIVHTQNDTNTSAALNLR
jgi:hypothetical protein